MKTYPLTNEGWFRGNGSGHSYVCSPEPNAALCCLGNVLRAEGATMPLHYTTLGQLPSNLLPTPLRALTNDTPTLQRVYYTNDKPGLTITERVAELNALTQRFGFQFEFVP